MPSLYVESSDDVSSSAGTSQSNLASAVDLWGDGSMAHKPLWWERAFVLDARSGSVHARTQPSENIKFSAVASLDMLRVSLPPILLLTFLQIVLVLLLGFVGYPDWRYTWPDGKGATQPIWLYPCVVVLTSMGIVVGSVSLIAWTMYSNTLGEVAEGQELTQSRLWAQTALFCLFSAAGTTSLLLLFADGALSEGVYRAAAGVFNLVLATMHAFFLTPVPTAKPWVTGGVFVLAIAVGVYFALLTTAFFRSDLVVFRFFFRLLLHPLIWSFVSFATRLCGKQAEGTPEHAKATLAVFSSVAESLFGRFLIVAVGTFGESVALAALVAIANVLLDVLMYARDRVVESLQMKFADRWWIAFFSSFRETRIYSDARNVEFVMQPAEIISINSALLAFGFNPSSPGLGGPGVAEVALSTVVQLVFTMFSDFASRAWGEYHSYSYLWAYHTRPKGWLTFIIFAGIFSLSFILVLVFSRTATNVAVG